MQGREASGRLPPGLSKLLMLQAQDGGQAREGVEDILDEVEDGADVKRVGERADGVQQAGDLVDERAEVDVDRRVDLTLREASQAAEVETAQLGQDAVQCRGDLGDGGFDVCDRAVNETADQGFHVADLAGQPRQQTCHGRQEPADQVRHRCQVEPELTLAQVQVFDEVCGVAQVQIKSVDVDIEADVALG